MSGQSPFVYGRLLCIVQENMYFSARTFGARRKIAFLSRKRAQSVLSPLGLVLRQRTAAREHFRWIFVVNFLHFLWIFVLSFLRTRDFRFSVTSMYVWQRACCIRVCMHPHMLTCACVYACCVRAGCISACAHAYT